MNYTLQSQPTHVPQQQTSYWVGNTLILLVLVFLYLMTGSTLGILAWLKTRKDTRR